MTGPPTAQIREASEPLAHEVNPQTVRAQAEEIARLQRRVFVVESLLRRQLGWERDALRFVEERREDVCTRWKGRAATLHTIAEQDTPAFAEVQVRMLTGDLSGLWMLCSVCVREECGGQEEPCGDADVLSPEERFAQQIPEYLHASMERLVAARGAAEENE